MIQFRIVTHSGVPPYLQLVHQVRQALQTGVLQEGDRLPTIREVLQMVTINPNTVAKAYRELESLGIVKGKAGVGTFITKPPAGPDPSVQRMLARELAEWVRKAKSAGLDDLTMAGLLDITLREEGGLNGEQNTR